MTRKDSQLHSAPHQGVTGAALQLTWVIWLGIRKQGAHSEVKIHEGVASLMDAKNMSVKGFMISGGTNRALRLPGPNDC